MTGRPLPFAPPSATPPRLILASASPRRRELLSGLGLTFEARPAPVDESARPGETPAAYVRRVALEKAVAGGQPGEIVLAADTTVVIDGRLLGKPRDPEEARWMLGLLAGRRHRVLTAVAVSEPAHRRRAAGVATSRVRIAALGAAEIAWYVATGEPMDKAGAYAVQGLGALFVESITGNYTNVVGLPLPLTVRLFARLGHDLTRFRAAGLGPPRP